MRSFLVFHQRLNLILRRREAPSRRTQDRVSVGWLRPIAVLLAVLVASPLWAAELPAPWVELGADGALSVRAVVAPGTACPPVTAGGAAVTARPRREPDSAFPVQVCEALVPAGPTRVAVGGMAVQTLPARVRRI